MALGGRGSRAVARRMAGGAAHRTETDEGADIDVGQEAARWAERRRDSGIVRRRDSGPGRHMDSGPVPRTGSGPVRHRAVAAEADRTPGEGVAGRRRIDPVGVVHRRGAAGVVRRVAGSSHLAEEEVLLRHLLAGGLAPGRCATGRDRSQVMTHGRKAGILGKTW